MENLEAIKIKAKQLTAELAANDAANAAEHAAACELLAKVIKIAQPAVRAVGDVYKSADRICVDGEPSNCWQTGRVIKLDSNYASYVFPTDLLLTEKGELAEVSKLQFEKYSDALVPRTIKSLSLCELTDATERITSAIISAGSRADATKATLARAEKLTALAKLL